MSEIAPEPTGHGLPLGKCEAYNRVYDQSCVEKDGAVSADYAGSSKSCLTRRSHYSYPENFSVARLDLLGLREHRDGIGSQQLHCR